MIAELTEVVGVCSNRKCKGPILKGEQVWKLGKKFYCRSGCLIDSMKEPNSTSTGEVINFDRFRRMKYHPEFHENHRKPFSESDLEYLCKYYEVDKVKNLMCIWMI